ncbi:hypothetical protein [Duganella hordei]|uniref:hypothetical protein n=1 Tax=Duganella hordei TaxID=2865934 RepID=UPI0030E8C6F1
MCCSSRVEIARDGGSGTRSAGAAEAQTPKRSVDARKIASPPAPLVALAEEVTFLARQLRQPPELTAQLLVLAELRGLRAESAGAALAILSVLS